MALLLNYFYLLLNFCFHKHNYFYYQMLQNYYLFVNLNYQKVFSNNCVLDSNYSKCCICYYLRYNFYIMGFFLLFYYFQFCYDFLKACFLSYLNLLSFLFLMNIFFYVVFGLAFEDFRFFYFYLQCFCFLMSLKHIYYN